MGIWNRVKSIFSGKNKVVKEIQKKNESNSLITQEKFDAGLRKSSGSLDTFVNNIAKKYHKVNDEMIEEIEETLLQYDLGPKACSKIMDSIVEEIKFQRVEDPNLVKQIIVDKLFVYYIQNTDINVDINIKPNTTNVVWVTGANGVGKTTSIAKLAAKYKNEGYKISLVAGDTFRAGAIEQLKVWANKLELPIFTPSKPGQDPASVIYNGVSHAKENGIDIVICDTSGRLQNKVNLMNELKKIDTVIKKFDPSQPCESLLVIDATTGQSGINQAKAFNEVTKITGIVLTKMDSTSKGGIILAIKDALNLPVKFIGLGESLEDIEEFNLEQFIKGLTENINL